MGTIDFCKGKGVEVASSLLGSKGEKREFMQVVMQGISEIEAGKVVSIQEVEKILHKNLSPSISLGCP